MPVDYQYFIGIVDWKYIIISKFFVNRNSYLKLYITDRKTMEFVPLFTMVFYLAVNKLIADKMQNIFYLIAKHSDFIKYSLN